MYRDPRGGHNQKSFNEDFFKTWSPAMSYILGFISADGAVVDARKSSRTCYTSIVINDIELLQQIKKAMNSTHPLHLKPGQYKKIKNKIYLCRDCYSLRFGSKEMFQDLVNLGITPRKSLRLKLPTIPNKYISFFIRGYFDGDGCVYLQKRKNNYSPTIQVIFTSGCRQFLDDLSAKLSKSIKIEIHKTLLSGNGAYQLRYRKFESIKILEFMYKNLKKAPYLKRKYIKAKPYLIG